MDITAATDITRGYDASDAERWAPEAAKRAGRTAFQRDRARVLHSSALRRLAAKTQVHVAFESDFPRTRLTHSLECAQVGRELGASLGADPDLIEAACLAHDLGHPPFGHSGEAELHEAAAICGGFEGNAQSLRILTRLEIKTFTDGIDGPSRSAGLNLTRATLDATVKYPWPRLPDRRKFGVYTDDREVFEWIRAGVPSGRDVQTRCFEAQVMDWADDVAYSVHDLEDALHDGSLTLAMLTDRSDRPALLALCRERYAGSGVEIAELDEALERLLALPWWPADFDGSARAIAAVKTLTSQLIGRFCGASELATRDAFGAASLTRYSADLVVPREVRLECAVLKAVTARYVMEKAGTEERYAREREIVAELIVALAADAPRHLDPVFADWYQQAPDEPARLRVVVDQVASLSDTRALQLHAALVGAARA
jgi:dGTPase